ncbi:Protein EMSY-LIKE 3 [Hibiscus syriacus]|uniref:Protein EMSY-LIKE 3 n=1 Tax=Hibiscus syriacus TaxID=106335 RepID=A0A6A3AEP8_HIBSY|nr:Protein EMSY-LIKE 3 [Hibiscus syriacus]
MGCSMRMYSDMEAQIHLLEQEAYCSVLRAFKAQSDAITWEKEGLITELRKELRVSDDEHRELLAKVNADDIIRRISPTVSTSRKKQKTSQSVTSINIADTIQSRLTIWPALFYLHFFPTGSFNAWLILSKGYALSFSVYAGSRQFNNRGFVAGFPANEPAEGATFDPLIGRKVWTRWPEDNNFYEAAITDYNPSEVCSRNTGTFSALLSHLS